MCPLPHFIINDKISSTSFCYILRFKITSHGNFTCFAHDRLPVSTWNVSFIKFDCRNYNFKNRDCLAHEQHIASNRLHSMQDIYFNTFLYYVDTRYPFNLSFNWLWNGLLAFLCISYIKQLRGLTLFLSLVLLPW